MSRFSIDAVFRAMDRITKPVDKMQARVMRFSKSAGDGLKSVDAVTGKLLTSLRSVSIGVAAVTTAAAVGLAAMSVPGRDFEQQMADLGATSLQTRAQIAPLEKEALRLGAATKFSATEVAAGMEIMAKAGFENEQILDGIGGMIYAAAAAGEDLATTTEHVSSVMKGMALPTSAAARVADVLALASVRTNSSISSLGESMSKVSSTARQLGVPLEDTVAMVALLQDVGLDASEAGSATATMLTMMAKPADEVAAKMRKMGVSFKDASGNMLAPAKVLGQLVKAGEKAGGNMDQVAFFADLVGMRGQKAAVNLKDLFKAGKVQGLVKELGSAAGTAKKMADLRMQTFNGDLDVMLENIKSVGIELFSLASGPLRDVLKGIGKWVDANKDFVVSGIVDTIKSIAENMPTIALWGERIAKFASVWLAFAAGVKVATLAMAAFNAVMALSPIGLIALAVVGAIALIVAFWPEISTFFSNLWDGITRLAGSIWESLTSVADSIGSALSAAFTSTWNVITGFLTGLFKFWVGAMTLIFAPVYARMRPAFDLIVSAAGWVIEHWSVVADFFAGLWSAVSGAAVAAFTFLYDVAAAEVGWLMEVWAPIGEFYSTLWGGIASAFYIAWEGIKSFAMSVFDAITSRIVAIYEKIAGLITTVRDIGSGTIDAVFGGGDVPQVVSSQERAADARAETSFGSGELTIRDQTNRAEVSKKPKGSLLINLKPSGAFSPAR